MSEIGLPLRQILVQVEMLQSAQVVAGADGLDQLVQWPQIADIPGMSDWLRAGDLLLTTAFALQEPVTRQRSLIRTLSQKGVVGMMVAVGRYFDHVPPPIRTIADDLGFPLIELPWQVPLLEIAKQISQQIITQQQELLSQSLNIHQTLTQLVLQGANLDAVAQALAQLLGRSVTIEDANLVLLAYASDGPEDEARQLSIRQLRTPRPLVKRLQESGILADLQRSPRPMRVSAKLAEEITMERIVAPVVAGGEVLGYVWVIIGQRPPIHLDFVAIEHAATVAALIIAKERAVQQATERRYDDLLDRLLDGKTDLTSAIVAEAQRLGLDLQRSYCVLLVSGSTLSPESLARVESFLRQTLRRGGHSWLSRKRGDLVVVLDTEDIPLAREALARLQSEEDGIAAGLGNRYPSLSDLYRSYREAREAANIHASLQLQTPLTSFQKLGLLHWLYRLPEEHWSENPYFAQIQALAEYDAQHRSELLHTLETYLDCGANASAASQTLFLHRSTLLYRLQKCQTVCQVNLSSAWERLNLHVAIKAWRLRSVKL